MFQMLLLLQSRSHGDLSGRGLERISWFFYIRGKPKDSSLQPNGGSCGLGWLVQPPVVALGGLERTSELSFVTD